jgi:hypothetical protein
MVFISGMKNKNVSKSYVFPSFYEGTTRPEAIMTQQKYASIKQLDPLGLAGHKHSICTGMHRTYMCIGA